MKFVIFLCVVASAAAAPFDNPQEAEILRDNRVHSDGKAYSFDFETENGIKISEGGQLEDEAIVSSGTIEYPLPNGETFSLKFVANKNGYQPESVFLPTAPAFPHEIPEFVLEQIRFAEQQKAAEERRS